MVSILESWRCGTNDDTVTVEVEERTTRHTTPRPLTVTVLHLHLQRGRAREEDTAPHSIAAYSYNTRGHEIDISSLVILVNS